MFLSSKPKILYTLTFIGSMSRSARQRVPLCQVQCRTQTDNLLKNCWPLTVSRTTFLSSKPKILYILTFIGLMSRSTRQRVPLCLVQCRTQTDTLLKNCWPLTVSRIAFLSSKPKILYTLTFIGSMSRLARQRVPLYLVQYRTQTDTSV